MIDPLISLAFTLHSNKGAYALLIGSGVSRSAKIPTGWEVTLDLVTKVAKLSGEDCGSAPETWFAEKFGKEPDYSDLLDTLVKSPAERQQMLRGYFEPDEQEREDGLKQPQAAHEAIATLVESGVVRVIVTTNFDRLIEQALESRGITPIVLSTPDEIEGGLPLVHQKSCIIKLHGDYSDTRIKNTSDELAAYDDTTNRILDQVLDEFGLIVCGWSAEWDPALRAALERCKSRRFSLYWTAHREPREQAQKLIDNRRGVVVPIDSADSFFAELSEKVLAIDDLQQPHPLSVQAATATVKRYLSESKYRIRLCDLITGEGERAYEAIQDPLRDVLERGDRGEQLSSMLARCWSHTEILRAICIQSARWGGAEHVALVASTIQRLADDAPQGDSGNRLHSDVRHIPALIHLYACGLAATSTGDGQVIGALLRLPVVHRRTGIRRPLLYDADWANLNVWFKLLPGLHNRLQPMSDWLFEKCREPLRQFAPADTDYERVFDKFEIIRSVVYADIESGGSITDPSPTDDGMSWGPAGRFVWKMRRGSDEHFFSDLLSDEDLVDGLLKAGVSSGDRSRFELVMSRFKKFAESLSTRWH